MTLFEGLRRFDPRPQAFGHRAPRSKMCRHFENVARVAQDVASGHVQPPTGDAAKLLCEEYLMLHLEFQALYHHLGETK